MSSEEGKGPNLFESKMAEMNPSDFSPWPHLAKGVALYGSYYFGGWPGLGSLVYLLIGDSLARRVGQERWKPRWLAVTLLWPTLLLLDVADLSEDDA